MSQRRKRNQRGRAGSWRSIDEITTQVGLLLAPERQRLWRQTESHLTGERAWSGQDGYASAMALSAVLESNFEEHLNNRNGLKLFAGMRQLSQRLWSHMGTRADEFVGARRSVADLALHRYAKWTPVEASWSMPTWDPGSLGALVRFFVLAEVYSDLVAARRRLGKGAKIQVVGGTDIWFRDVERDSMANRLIGSIDERQRRDPNVFSSYAALNYDAGVQGDRILAAEWADPADIGHDYEMLGSLPPQMRKGITPSFFERVATAGYLQDMQVVRETFSVYSEALEATHGISLLDIECALDIASSKVIAAWTEPRLLNLHGFELAPWPTPQDIVNALMVSRMTGLNAWTGVTPTRVIAALSFLDSADQVAELDNPMAYRPLRRMGDTMLYDAIHARIPNALLWQLDLPQKTQKRFASEFEASVHHDLGQFGTQPWPSGKALKSDGVQLTDVDASVVLDELLVVVDCYSSPWTPELDGGSHSQVRNRGENLQTKYDEWVRKWKRIADNNVHLVPTGVERILPVVVTAGTEWINSDAEDRWFTDEIPRVCSAHELRTLLSDSALKALAGWIDVSRS